MTELHNNRPAWPTSEEYGMMKEYVLLPLVQAVFERDAQIIADHVRTNVPYVSAIQYALDRISANMADIRSEFRRSGIRVLRSNRVAEGMNCIYLCRGYENEFQMRWEAIRHEVEQRMKYYLGEPLVLYNNRKTRT